MVAISMLKCLVCPTISLIAGGRKNGLVPFPKGINVKMKPKQPHLGLELISLSLFLTLINVMVNKPNTCGYVFIQASLYKQDVAQGQFLAEFNRFEFTVLLLLVLLLHQDERA